jgi:hypothetical protein
MHYVGRIPLYTIEGLDKYAKKRIGPPRRSTSDVDGNVERAEA